MAKIGRYEVPEDWPVKGEAGRSFAEKLKNGFFSTYMAGEVTIDVGYRGAFEDAVPILPHAIGVDLDYPAYDGKKLPFPDESIDTVYSSHMLEHVADFRTTIRDWHRVVRSGGFIVCVVPHQFLYEKRRSLPSSWNADHKRFYTPGSLLREFEISLRPNTYRVRHLRDSDENYTYEIGPQIHSGGGYEIEIVVQKIAPPAWDLAGPADPFQDYLERALNEVSRLTVERDALSGESDRWFDAAILAPAELVLRTPPPSRGRGWRRLARSLQAGSRRTNWEAIERADRALDSGKWERAARLYLDGLSTTPDASDLWLQLGQALEATGKRAEAAFAFREAERRAMRRRGRKPGSQFQRLFRRLEGATADAGRLLEIRKHQPSQNPPPAATILPELEKLQHLQTAPVDENPGIEAGRNISAGYVRGTGLQYGNLVPSIEQDPDWIAAIGASRGRSIVAPHRLMNLFLIIKYSEMPGNIIEFGAYTGGSSIFMAALSKRLGKPSKVFALDTFTGMPASDPLLDMHGAGDFPANFDELQLLKTELKLDNLVLIKGLFENGVRQIPAEERRFCLSHVDCDIYTSVRFSIAFAKEHAVPGAYIIFDDPLTSNCLGALKPVEEDLVQKEGLFAEQVYPHLVYRFPPLGR